MKNADNMPQEVKERNDAIRAIAKLSKWIYDACLHEGFTPEQSVRMATTYLLKKEFIKAIFKGEIVTRQEFITVEGIYRIVFVRCEGDIYFFKYLDGEMTECCNLSKKKGWMIV